MKSIFLSKLILSISLAAILLSSCEDVIEVDINESPGDLIVDAWLNDLDTTQYIKLTLAQGYFDNSAPLAVQDATVSILRDDNVMIEFLYQGEGLYAWTPNVTNRIGNAGDEFTLNISVNGTVYQGESRMNRVPNIDSIGFELRVNEIFGPDGQYANFYSRDMPGLGDTYWIKTYRDGIYQGAPAQLNIAYDAGFDGGTGADGIVFITPIREFLNINEDGDDNIPYASAEHIKVELHAINQGAFNFLQIARDQINNGNNGIFSIPLANTKTNITASDNGVVLGFFNVATVSVSERNAPE